MGTIRQWATALALFGKVWASASWMWGNFLTVVEQIGPPEYAAIIVFCLAAIIILNHGWINASRPSVKFQNLADEIEEVIPMISMGHDASHGSRELFEGRLEALRWKLRAFQIELPDDRETLLNILPTIWACALNRDLRAARKLARLD